MLEYRFSLSAIDLGSLLSSSVDQPQNSQQTETFWGTDRTRARTLKAEAVPICMSTWVCGGAHLWLRASLDPEAGGIEILPIRMPEDWISIMPTLNGAASGLRWLEGQLVPPDESGPVQIGV